MAWQLYFCLAVRHGDGLDGCGGQPGPAPRPRAAAAAGLRLGHRTLLHQEDEEETWPRPKGDDGASILYINKHLEAFC